MSLTPSTFGTKRVAEIEEREIQWERALPTGATIATSAWAVSPAGLTVVSTSSTATLSRIRVSGGTSGRSYTLTCTVTTNGGLVLIESAELTVA